MERSNGELTPYPRQVLLLWNHRGAPSMEQSNGELTPFPRQVLLLWNHRGAPRMERSHGGLNLSNPSLTQPTTSQRCSKNGAISW